jgi:alginate production protein
MIPALLASLLLLVAPEDETSSPEVLAVGNVIAVRGTLDADGRLVAQRVTLEDARSDEVLLGTLPASQDDMRRFTLLGQLVETHDETEWRELRPGSLAGKRVKVQGSWKGPRKFRADTISPRGSGRDRILGRLDEFRPIEGGWEGRIMIFTVFIPEGVLVEHELAVDQYGLAPGRKTGQSSSDSEYLSRDEDDAFGKGYPLTDTLRIQGQLEVKVEDSNNYNLDSGKREDRTDFKNSGRIRLVWSPSDSVAGLIEARYLQRYRRDDDDGVNDSQTKHGSNLGEAWLQWRDVFGHTGFDLTAGRQDFDEIREWIFDQNLDALRATWIRPDWRLDLSTAGTLTEGGERDKASQNGIAYLSNNDEDRHLAAWAVYRDIDDFTNRNGIVPEEESMYLGVRAIGEWLPDNQVWADFAYQMGTRPLFDVNGSSTGVDADVAAWAYDMGTTWSPEFAGPLYFTLGYALGTGSGADGTFRQTGWQDNTNKFGGVTSFRYYGELFDPELSNMGIFTLGAGAMVADRTSLDLVFHTYKQDEIRAEFSPLPSRTANLRQSPNGIDADLGLEADLILGMRHFQNWDLEIVAATFRPGDAFDSQDNAYFLKFQLRYRF